jgi:hypothetical protein
MTLEDFTYKVGTLGYQQAMLKYADFPISHDGRTITREQIEHDVNDLRRLVSEYLDDMKFEGSPLLPSWEEELA